MCSGRGAVTAPASTPSWYLVATSDEMIPPPAQRPCLSPLSDEPCPDRRALLDRLRHRRLLGDRRQAAALLVGERSREAHLALDAVLREAQLDAHLAELPALVLAVHAQGDRRARAERR